MRFGEVEVSGNLLLVELAVADLCFNEGAPFAAAGDENNQPVRAMILFVSLCRKSDFTLGVYRGAFADPLPNRAEHGLPELADVGQA